MSTPFPLSSFQQLETPFYYYDCDLLRATLLSLREALSGNPRFHVHYAIKANANPRILHMIAQAGLGADCVSGGEVTAAIAAGFPAEKVVFAGVGKSDREIICALRAGIACFNVESVPELEVINALAGEMNTTANVALRINPNVDAHTSKKITTGLDENKFGIAMDDMISTIRRAEGLPNLHFVGLHFHIGSQIEDLSCFDALSERINELQDEIEAAHFNVDSINVGGGLGIDYREPELHPIPRFREYIDRFRSQLRLRPHQHLHFELGRSIVGQCGTLISRVLFVKKGHTKSFLILDAGFTDLIRPAMYGARHAITNIDAEIDADRPMIKSKYDVVGPICESSDVFATDQMLSMSLRGDLIAIHSAGAYGEVMASTYNCRRLPSAFFSDDLRHQP